MCFPEQAVCDQPSLIFLQVSFEYPPFFDLRVVPLAVDSLGPSKNFIVFLVHNLTINTGRQNSPPYHLQYILGGSICQRLFFFYHIPITCCIKRLTTVIPIQQQPPSKIGFPPDLISLIMLLFKPIAAMAIIIKNLLSSLSGLKT